MIGDETSLNEDSRDDIKWNRQEVLSLWNKACHLAEKLEQVASGLEAAKENYRNEIEDWRKEREEQIIRERKILEESEELRKELQAWMNQNITSRPRTASFSSHVQPSCEEIVSYTTEIIDSMWPNAFSPLESDEEDVENVEQVDESTVEENNTEENEVVEEPEQQENQETTENEEETAENEEETVEVLEYTPVASTVEVLSSSSRLECTWKRKADSPAGDENIKKRRLILVECPVCLEALPDMVEIGKVLMVTVCGHVMCSNCAMRLWIQRRNRCRCPKCHKKYKIDTLQPVYL